MISQRQYFKAGFLISAVIAALSFFIFVLGAPVSAAETFTYPNFTISSQSDGEVWGVGELAEGSIVNGVLTFEVKGFQQEAVSEKRQVFAMYDGAAPSLYNNHSYFMHLRKRARVPQAGNRPGLQFKGAIDCDWFDPEANFATESWNPDTTYRFTIDWDEDGATLTMTNQADGSWSGSVGYTYPFLAQRQEIVFGAAGMANSPAFPAEAGLEYSNISLEVQAVDEYDDLGGYPPCEETFQTDPETREDQPGTDAGDPYDDPNNPYDQCACAPADGINSVPCEDPKEGKDEFSITDPPFRISVKKNDAGIPTGLRVKPLWTFDRIATALWDKEEASESNPAIDLNVASPSVTTGGTMNVTIAPENFQTMLRNLYLNWCLTRGDTGETQSYNAVIAGGKLAQPYQPQGWAGGGCCSPLTRAVTSDTDGDGMDDGWEREKFLGREVNGVMVTESNIDSVIRPDDDLDHDGYYARKFINQEGRPVTAAPALVDHQGRFYHPGGPDAKLTNVEEYILGTDPLDGDTDNDGWGDEMDYMGIGATNFSFPVELAPGPNGYYLLTATVVGINSNGLVSVAARSKRLEVSEGEALAVALTSPQTSLPIDERPPGGFMSLSATISGPEVEPEDLYFEWFFNGQSVCDLPNYSDFCQLGRDTIEFGGMGEGNRLIDLPGLKGETSKMTPGTPYLFAVRVTDPMSRRSADASLYLPISTALHLTTACSDTTGDSPRLPTDSGAPTTICVEELQAGSTDANNFLNANWQWSLDNVNLQDQSGLGKSTLAITPTELAGSQQRIQLEIYDVAAGGLLARAARNFATTGPAVSITEPAPEFYGGGRGASRRLVRGQPGETIRFAAEARDFPVNSETTFSWQAGGAQSTGVNQTTFEYAVPVEAQTGQAIPVSVRAQSRAGAVLMAEDQVTLLVGEPAAAAGWGEKINASLAAVSSLIPPNLSLAFKIVFAAMIIGGLAWGVMRFSRLMSS